MRLRDWLVYRFASERPDPKPILQGLAAQSIASESLDVAAVHRWFGDDPKRAEQFASFAGRACRGVVLTHGDQWVTHAWMSPPGVQGPPHLPSWTRELGTYWIFHCETRSSHRGRGLYRLALRLLVAEALAEQASAEVMIDTAAANVASRRAILGAGFEPRGVVTTVNLWIPRLYSRVLGGWWSRGRVHPLTGG